MTAAPSSNLTSPDPSLWSSTSVSSSVSSSARSLPPSSASSSAAVSAYQSPIPPTPFSDLALAPMSSAWPSYDRRSAHRSLSQGPDAGSAYSVALSHLHSSRFVSLSSSSSGYCLDAAPLLQGSYDNRENPDFYMSFESDCNEWSTRSFPLRPRRQSADFTELLKTFPPHFASAPSRPAQ